jgi:hypothetical protein
VAAGVSPAKPSVSVATLGSARIVRALGGFEPTEGSFRPASAEKQHAGSMLHLRWWQQCRLRSRTLSDFPVLARSPPCAQDFFSLLRFTGVGFRTGVGVGVAVLIDSPEIALPLGFSLLGVADAVPTDVG